MLHHRIGSHYNKHNLSIMTKVRNLLSLKHYRALLAELARGLQNSNDMSIRYLCRVSLLCAGTGKRISDVCKFTRAQITMLRDVGSFSFRVQKTNALGIVNWYHDRDTLKKILENWVEFKCSRASLYRTMEKFVTSCGLPKIRGLKFHEFRFKLAGQLYDSMKTHNEVKQLLDHKSNKVTTHYIAQELYNIFKEREQII